jgi:hypothetical protein
MNGVEFEQSTAMQQVFEISRTEVKAHAPCEAMSVPREMRAAHDARRHHHHHHHHHLHESKLAARARKFRAWLHSQPTPVRVFFSLLTGTLFGLFVILAIRISARLFAFASGYKRVASSAPAAVVIFDADEKSKFLVVSEKEGRMLPSYEQ